MPRRADAPVTPTPAHDAHGGQRALARALTGLGPATNLTPEPPSRPVAGGAALGSYGSPFAELLAGGAGGARALRPPVESRELDGTSRRRDQLSSFCGGASPFAAAAVKLTGAGAGGFGGLAMPQRLR